MPFLVFLAVFFLAAGPLASAEPRYPVRADLKIVDVSSGKTFELAGNQGYSYELVSSDAADARVRIFDRHGKEIQGVFKISGDQLELVRNGNINAGLRATVGPQGAVPGCCDVNDPRDVPPTVASRPAPTATQTSTQTATATRGAVRPAPPPARVAAPPLPVPPSRPAPRPGLVASEEPAPAPRPLPEAVPLPRPRPADLRPASPAPAPLPSSVAVAPPRAPRSESRYCEIYRRFRGRVPDAPLRQALQYLAQEPGNLTGADARGRTITNTDVLSIADYSQPSENERFYVLNLRDGTVRKEKVSHGSGRCRVVRGARVCEGGTNSRLQACGTHNGSRMTRAGFFRVDDTYFSQNGRYNGWSMLEPGSNGLRMTGLVRNVNWNARDDGIVMHEAPNYNSRNPGVPMGRSNGCPAFARGCLRQIVDDLSGGSLFYSYAPVCAAHMRVVLSKLPNWQHFCE